jgi:hypothetical protein
MRLAAQHADWVLGCVDETWWSRLAQPALHSWTGGKPLRLIAQDLPKGDPDLKALACYGRLRLDSHDVLLRFVDGRPVSHVTTAFLAALPAAGRRAETRLGAAVGQCLLAYQPGGPLVDPCA